MVPIRLTLFAAVAAVLLAGCTDVSKEAVVCNSPYIRVGTECCLDRDGNKICDRDEGGPATSIDWLKFWADLGAPKSAPNASLKLVRANAQSFCLEHQGGDTINGDVGVFISGSATGVTFPGLPFRAGESKVFATGAIAAGNRIRLVDNVSSQQIASFSPNSIESGTGNVTCP